MKGIAVAALAGLASPALSLPADFRANAERIVQSAYPADGPGAIAVVFEKGRPVFAMGRGLADVDKKLPLDPAMPVRLGSITKPFTAALVMTLVEEGKIGLDDPLSKYLPDYPEPGANATVRQLLNHTSGIKSYTGIPGAMIGEGTMPQTTASMIKLFKDAPLDFPAGTDWAYNNSGYVLLGAIVEKMTGRPWHVALDERIAQPLGLKNLRYGGKAGGELGVPTPYTRGSNGPAPAIKIDMSFPHAAGSLVGTAADIAAFARALQQGKVVSKASYALMTAPTVLPGGRIAPYGFGLIPGDVRGHKSVSHNGGIPGFSTDGLYLPGDDIYVAVFANSDRPMTDPETVSRKLAAAALGDPYPEFTAVPLNPVKVTPFVGIYRAGDIERRFFLRNGKLYTQRTGNPPLEVTPADGNRFFYADSLSWFEIAAGADGKAVMRFHANGERDGAVVPYAGTIPPEAPPAAVARADLERLAGRYEGPESIIVAIDGQGQLTLTFGSQPVTHLVPESATLFRVEEVDAKVEFRLENGRATALGIHQGGRTLLAKRAN